MLRPSCRLGSSPVACSFWGKKKCFYTAWVKSRPQWVECPTSALPSTADKPLATLRDARLYITKLPKAEHDAAEWQAALEALLLVAEHSGPAMFARIGVMRALNRHVERLFNSTRKDPVWR